MESLVSVLAKSILHSSEGSSGLLSTHLFDALQPVVGLLDVPVH